MAGKAFKELVKVQEYSSRVSDGMGGYTTASLTDLYSVKAKVVEKSGSFNFEDNNAFTKVYEIEFLYDPTKPISNKHIVEVYGHKAGIRSIEFSDSRRIVKLKAYL